MTNLWTVLYFTLGITLTGLMLVLFKRLFRDKLSARWHYLVWLVFAPFCPKICGFFRQALR